MKLKTESIVSLVHAYCGVAFALHTHVTKSERTSLLTPRRSITHPLAMDNVGIMHPRQSAFFGMSPTYRSAPPLARRGHFPPKLRYSDEEPRRDEKRSKEIYDDFDEDEMIDDEGNYDYEPRVGAVRRRSESECCTVPYSTNIEIHCRLINYDCHMFVHYYKRRENTQCSESMTN